MYFSMLDTWKTISSFNFIFDFMMIKLNLEDYFFCEFQCSIYLPQSLLFIIIKKYEILCQFFCRRKVSCVNVRFSWSHLTVICSSKNNLHHKRYINNLSNQNKVYIWYNSLLYNLHNYRNDIWSFHDLPELFCYVLVAEGVFERQIKLVNEIDFLHMTSFQQS